METETLSNVTEHKTVVEDSSGNTQTVTETVTQETDVVVPEVAEVPTPEIETEPEGIDETWLEERFSRLSVQLASLLEAQTMNQTTVNRLIELNQQLQTTMSEMASKMVAPTLAATESISLTPAPSLVELPAPTTPPPDVAPAGPEKTAELPAGRRKTIRRKI